MKFKICYPLNTPFPINQRWNENPQYYNTIGMKGHNGWDFCVSEGTPVYATHDGTVWFAGIDGTMSKTILLISDQSYDYKDTQAQFKTAYAHLSDYFVTPGQKVKRGEKIGVTGNTGRYTTGPHLHFGIHPVSNYSDIEAGNGYNGCIDPAPYFDGYYPNSPAVPVTTAAPQVFLDMQKAILAFQISEGITVFKDKPLENIKYGPATLTAAQKYLK